jgi:ABC-2 type transport system ATP-binding protein
MEHVAATYLELQVEDSYKDHALAHNPIHVRRVLGGFSMLYESGAQRESLAQLGRLTVPSLSELFIAKIKPKLAE